jgi:hypothetical protein
MLMFSNPTSSRYLGNASIGKMGLPSLSNLDASARFRVRHRHVATP